MDLGNVGLMQNLSCSLRTILGHHSGFNCITCKRFVDNITYISKTLSFPSQSSLSLQAILVNIVESLHAGLVSSNTNTAKLGTSCHEPKFLLASCVSNSGFPFMWNPFFLVPL